MTGSDIGREGIEHVAASLQCRAHQRDFPPDKKCESGLVTVTSHKFQYSGMCVVGFVFFSLAFCVVGKRVLWQLVVRISSGTDCGEMVLGQSGTGT